MSWPSKDWEYQMRRQMQEILPGLYLGPYAAAMKNQLDNLKAHGITHIVCVRQDCEAPFIKENLPGHFIYLTTNMKDSPTENIIPFFPQFADYIDSIINDNVGGKVLVHGNGGISRSATLVASYVMHKNMYTASDAIRLIQLKRFCIFPNEGFRRQLYEYEPILRAKIAASRRGILSVSNNNEGEPSQNKRRINDVDPDDDQDLSPKSPTKLNSMS